MRYVGILHDETGKPFEVDMDIEPYKPTVQTLYGVDCTPAEVSNTLGTYPGLRYQRDFGKGKPPVLTAPRTGRLMQLPNTVMPHVSWKLFDPVAFEAWLDALDRNVFLTFYHEPMGDIDTSSYAKSTEKMVSIMRSHPNSAYVKHHGPVVTRYWLEEGRGRPEMWWYDGATAYFADCYSPEGAPTYLPPTDMFAAIAATARSYGVPWGVPEFGAKRLAADQTGVKRAAWMQECARVLEEQVDCLCVAWWNFEGGWHLDQYGNAPEKQAWRDIVLRQGL